MVAHETQGFILVRGAVRANPYSSGVAALLVFVYSIIGAVAPSYEVDWNGECCRSGHVNHGVLSLLYIGRGIGLQRGQSMLQIRFLVCYNRRILSYHGYDGGRYLRYVVIFKLVVAPSPRGLPPRSSLMGQIYGWWGYPRPISLTHQYLISLLFFCNLRSDARSIISSSIIPIYVVSWVQAIEQHKT